MSDKITEYFSNIVIPKTEDNPLTGSLLELKKSIELTENNLPLASDNPKLENVIKNMDIDTVNNIKHTNVINDNIDIKQTFNTIYKNLYSYDSVTDITDPKYIKKSYSSKNGKIYVIIDSKIKGKVITMISGDIGSNRTLVKIVDYTAKTIIEKYSIK